MLRHCSSFKLWVLCTDKKAIKILNQLNLEKTELLDLAKVETTELLRIKEERTVAEYCWTLTPFAPKFVFEADSTIDRITYIDADIWFRKSPKPIFDELEESGKSVLITEHSYSPEYDFTETSGRFCVQFLTFHRTGGETVREDWEEKCLEWCYARSEDGKFGDQKYLDHWPHNFPDRVHILQEKEYALAPWNVNRYPYGKSIFYHFQALRIRKNNTLCIGPAIPIPKLTFENIHKPYLEELKEVQKLLTSIDERFKIQDNSNLLNKKIRFWIKKILSIFESKPYKIEKY
jgi:hypothetical protein